eukprot:gene46664-55213_t
MPNGGATHFIQWDAAYTTWDYKQIADIRNDAQPRPNAWSYERAYMPPHAEYDVEMLNQLYQGLFSTLYEDPHWPSWVTVEGGVAYPPFTHWMNSQPKGTPPTVTTIVSPTVLAKAQEYFDCTDLPGLELEDFTFNAGEYDKSKTDPKTYYYP